MQVGNRVGCIAAHDQQIDTGLIKFAKNGLANWVGKVVRQSRADVKTQQRGQINEARNPDLKPGVFC